MAEEVQIRIWCDVCLSEEQTRTGAEIFTLNGSRVDLCDVHAMPVETALELVARYGRQETTGEPTGGQACPECGRTFKSPGGVAMHRARAHGVPGASKRRRAAA